uniref:Neuronal regeneration-related protein n=1 Tax=Accipiter nisus TaxID=211598 RepID=A0A8B9MIR5_9AVES
CTAGGELQKWLSLHRFFPSNTVFSSLQGSLPISKEVNRKKKSEAEGACLVPVDGYGYHFTQINHICSF